MKEIIILISFFLLFIIAAIVLGIGINKRQKKIILIAIVTLCLSGITTIYSFSKVIFRSGEEIYMALFDKPQFDCLKIINYQDQTVPILDAAIWLHFNTCPDELNRIINSKDFEIQKVSTKGWNTSGPLADENWFKPELLGDTILTFRYQQDYYGGSQTIYCNLNKTEAYCIDAND